jgi:hypothetical protein
VFGLNARVSEIILTHVNCCLVLVFIELMPHN